MVFKLVNAAAKTWVPTVTSHAEKSAHITSAMRQYTTSMSSVPTKHAMGMGTSMGGSDEHRYSLCASNSDGKADISNI
jgi:hypothetical protein